MNSEIWFFPIAALVNAVTSTVLAFYLLMTGFSKRMTRYLFYLCFTTAAWSFPYFFWQIADNPVSALFWGRLLMFGAIFTSMSYLHLVVVFLELDKQKFYKFVLGIFYLVSFLCVFANLTPFFVSEVVAMSYFKFWPIAGPFYLFFIVAFCFEFVYASFLLFRNLKYSKGVKRKQTFLLLVGILVAFVGGSSNYPLWYNINIAPWGNILVSIYVILTVYAIMKYKFLNIKVISAELFTGFFFIIFLIDIFLSKSIPEMVFRIGALLVLVIFGVMLLRSVRKEVDQREEVTKLAKILKKANLRLQELDRQKTEFLSIASHQLRTPLSIIKGYLELLGDGAYGKVTGKMKGILLDMDESNERLVKLVDEFLDITRIEQGRTKFHFDNFDMNDLVASVIKELKEKADEKKVKIIWKRRKKIVKVCMDEEKIRNVIFNYIDNALKYSDKNVTVILIANEKKVTVRVKDNGVGFSKEDGASLFEKFFRGKNVEHSNVNGTGLGIYVCKKFIDVHSGEVWAKSKGVGKGSEFGFRVPLICPHSKEIANKVT